MSELLDTLRLIDKRKLTSAEELGEVAKQYNVKARVWQAGIPLQKIDKKIYQKIRDRAVEELCHKGGGTVDELCRMIEQLIDDGACGLGKKTYMSRNRRQSSPLRQRETMPAAEQLFAKMVREGQNGRGA